jgi:hypothetical protein
MYYIQYFFYKRLVNLFAFIYYNFVLCLKDLQKIGHFNEKGIILKRKLSKYYYCNKAYKKLINLNCIEF